MSRPGAQRYICQVTSPRVSVAQRLVALLFVLAPALLALDKATSPALVAAAFVLAALAIVLLCGSCALPVAAVSTPRHAFAWLTRGPTRQGDPDAAGHARPRAPGFRTRAV